MIVKIHKTPDGKKVVAVCDKGLIGKKFKEKNIQLDLSSDFYNGKEMNEEEILELFKAAYIINLVGEKSIELGIKAGIIDKDNVIYVQKIPHAQGLL